MKKQEIQEYVQLIIDSYNPEKNFSERDRDRLTTLQMKFSNWIPGLIEGDWDKMLKDFRDLFNTPGRISVNTLFKTRRGWSYTKCGYFFREIMKNMAEKGKAERLNFSVWYISKPLDD